MKFKKRSIRDKIEGQLDELVDQAKDLRQDVVDRAPGVRDQIMDRLPDRDELMDMLPDKKQLLDLRDDLFERLPEGRGRPRPGEGQAQEEALQAQEGRRLRCDRRCGCRGGRHREAPCRQHADTVLHAAATHADPEAGSRQDSTVGGTGSEEGRSGQEDRREEGGPGQEGRSRQGCDAKTSRSHRFGRPCQESHLTQRRRTNAGADSRSAPTINHA